MTGTLTQLGALLALRWRMLRAPGARLAMVVGALVLAELLRLLLSTGRTVQPEVLTSSLEVAPGAFLGFGVLALVAPLTAGGGQHVVPPDQLVAYPVRASTHFLGGLLLAPVNLVWVLQLFVLATLTSWLSLDGDAWLPALTTAAYVISVTTAGQALAWLVVGARQSTAGRRTATALAALAAVVVAALVRAGRGEDLLLHGPTTAVVDALHAGARRDVGGWLPLTAALVVVAVISLGLGAVACGWALRRPSDLVATSAGSTVRRRPLRRSALAELVAVDRASVWRATALRRGALVLALLPGVLAAAAHVPWESLIVLPGLVAAGAGLLFGINLFALDSSGAVWLASLPVSPRMQLLSKTLVLTETVLAAVVIAAVAAAVRSPGHPTGPQLAGVASSSLACTAIVVASCLSSSVRRPHRGDLAGPRDAIAPPGALAAASARLALPCAVVALVVATASHLRATWAPVAIAGPVVLLSIAWTARSVRRWDDAGARARVVQVVAAG